MTRQVIGCAIVLGIIGGITIDAYNLSHPETFQTQFVYVAEAREPEIVQIAVEIEWSKDRINKEIEEQAALYKRDPEYMKKLIKCESMGSTTIQSYHVRNGVREESWGLSQIHLPSHPTVTKEEAIEPKFAIHFMAKNLGRVKWSCEDLI